MTVVTNLMESHEQAHDEAQSLLESAADADSLVRQLDETLNALESASSDMDALADINARAMRASLDKIVEVMQVNMSNSSKPRRQLLQGGLERRQLLPSLTPAASPRDGEAGVASWSPAGPAAPSNTPAAGGAAMVSENAAPSGAPENAGVFEMTEEEEELRGALDVALKAQRQLDDELGTTRELLKRASTQLVGAKMRTGEARMKKTGAAGGRLTDNGAQTEPEQHQAVIEALHESLQERDRAVEKLEGDLAEANVALGELRKPIAKPVPTPERSVARRKSLGDMNPTIIEQPSKKCVPPATPRPRDPPRRRCHGLGF